MIAYRDGNEIALCDICYEPIPGEADIKAAGASIERKRALDGERTFIDGHRCAKCVAANRPPK